MNIYQYIKNNLYTKFSMYMSINNSNLYICTNLHTDISLHINLSIYINHSMYINLNMHIKTNLGLVTINWLLFLFLILGAYLLKIINSCQIALFLKFKMIASVFPIV